MPVAADETYMQETLRLARRGRGRTNPNPMVGAVIVRRGRVLGRGYHRRAGQPHAEIEALRAASGHDLKGATLYVNLEPCAHYGRTPPCADALIEAGISRVVYAMADPNPQVRGKGAARLRRAGVEVLGGVGGAAAERLNEAYVTFHAKRRPFIALKFAASLDGKLATAGHDSKWITNEPARAFARRLRAEYQAILVGVETVLSDDPDLGSHQRSRPDPKRIILDSRLRLPLTAQVLRDGNVIVATTRQAPAAKLAALRQRGIEVLTFPGVRVPLPALLDALREADIISVLVEGGGAVLGDFLDQRLVDKVYAFYAPLLIGGERAVSIGGHGAEQVRDALRLRDVSTRRFQDNILIAGYPHLQ